MKRAPTSPGLTPHRAQLEAQLHALTLLLDTADVDALVAHAVALWLASGRRCASGPGTDAVE